MFAVSVVGDNRHREMELGVQLVNNLTDKGFNVSFVVHYLDNEPVAGKVELDNGDVCYCTNLLQLSTTGTRLICNGKQSVSGFVPLLDADVLVVAGKGGDGLDWLPEIVIIDDDKPRIDSDSGKVIAYWGKGQSSSVELEDNIDILTQVVIDRGFSLPGLDCGGCGRSGCRDMAVEIIGQRADLSDCVALTGALSITINGQKVALNPFVTNLYQATFKAMLSQLKGYNSGNALVTIKI